MKITMLGHATLLLEVDGTRILTDPWLTEPLYFGQLTHPGNFTAFEKAPPADLVLVSHGHRDHFDPGTLESIPKSTPVVIAGEYEKAAKKAGFESVHPLRAGDAHALGGLEIKALPGKHPGGISTYMIQGREGRVFFGGDSVFTDALLEALRDTRPDVCLMPISGGRVGPLKFHMNAQEAAVLVRASGAGRAIPMHYHFQLKYPVFTPLLFRERCLEEFHEAMETLAPDTPVTVLDYNQTWEG